jgi:hypothetical protein
MAWSELAQPLEEAEELVDTCRSPLQLLVRKENCRSWNGIHHVIHIMMTLTLLALGYDCIFIKFANKIKLITPR